MPPILPAPSTATRMLGNCAGTSVDSTAISAMVLSPACGNPCRSNQIFRSLEVASTLRAAYKGKTTPREASPGKIQIDAHTYKRIRRAPQQRLIRAPAQFREGRAGNREKVRSPESLPLLFLIPNPCLT